MARVFPKKKVTAHQVTSDDLEIDSGTLSIDATNNRVGMGTTSPSAQLEVQDTTTSSANTGGSLRLSANDGSPMGDSHRLGVLEFTGAEDSSNTQVVGARIEAMTDAAWTNAENGTALYFYTTDGNASQTNVLKIDSNKKATFAGNITTDGSVSLKEKAAAIGDTAAYGQLWVKTATPNELYFTTDAGDDIQLTSGTATAFVGDITGVTAGVGLSGGGTTGALTLTLDLSELSAITPTATDSFATLDSDGATEQRTTITALSSFQAGSGLSASSGVLSVDSITSVGAVNSGSITSGFGAIDVGSSTITTTGNASMGDATLTGGDLNFGNGQNATASVAATAHNAAGKNLTVSAGTTTAGTTNNIAGGSLTIQAGQGKGSGAGGDIVFQTANAGGSGSSLNAHATALTISDDKSATFTGHVVFAESTSVKCGSNAILSDSSGTMTLSNIDAIDATTESTIEGAIDTLSNLASVGTITTGVWQGTAIAQAYIAGDAINGDKIADDSINSEHYVDGSIDTAHIADDQVTLAKMAGLARGGLIIGNASGNPTALSVGSDNHVLTVDSNGDIGWEAAAGGAVDLNGLSAATVAVAADSIAIIDANDSNASRKESIADLATAMAGDGVTATNGVFSLDVGASAGGFVSGGVRSTPDQAGEILAMQVFS